jgi:hypothetical protein
MSYYTYDPLIANTLARAGDVNARFQQVGTAFDTLPDAITLQQDRMTYGAAGGTADALTFAMASTLASYVEGLQLRAKIASDNTGPATINVDGLGVKAIKRIDGTALAAGDLPAGAIIEFVYDGTNFRMMRPIEVASGVTAASLLAALITVDGTGSGLDADTLRSTVPSAFGLARLADADAAAMRTALGLVIGTNVQAYDAELAALAGLTSAADRLAYFTGSGTASLATFTAAGRALVDDADTTAQRATLGLGSMALQASTGVAVTGGTLSNVTINGAATVISGISDLAVADGGTGASTAANARINLGVVIGTHVQAYSADLTAIAALTSAADKVLYATGAGTWALATQTAFARTLLDDADAATARGTLGISATNTPSSATGNIAATNVQSALAELDSEKAALAGAAFTGPVSSTGKLTVTSASGIEVSTTFPLIQITPSGWAGSSAYIESGVGAGGSGAGDLFRFSAPTGKSSVLAVGSADVAIASATGLAVTGLLTTSNGFRATGTNFPATGAGIEFGYTGALGTILAYDRAAAAYSSLSLRGSTVDVTLSGVQVCAFSSTGLAVTGNITGPRLKMLDNVAPILQYIPDGWVGDTVIQAGVTSNAAASGGNFLAVSVPTGKGFSVAVNYVDVLNVTSSGLAVAGTIRPASYTVATVPSASASGAGAKIYVTNEAGGATGAESDGTNWRRYADRAIIS